MKKIFVIVLSVMLALGLSACGNNDAEQKEYQIGESGSWTDGVYAETAEGKYGSFDVTVTIESGKIAAIEVGDNEETPEKGGVAISQLPEQMIADQTYDVDAVSGATVTSDGLKDAVARCLERASGLE